MRKNILLISITSLLLFVVFINSSIASNIPNNQRLMGNHMDCNPVSNYFIQKSADEKVSAPQSAWTVTGGTIVNYYDNNTRIEVEWYPNSLKSVSLSEFTLNGQRRITTSIINVQNCGNSQGPAYNNIFSSNFGTDVVSNTNFLISGTFTIDNISIVFNNCKIYLSNNAKIVAAPNTKSIIFNNCELYMGADSEIISTIEGVNIVFEGCNLENRFANHWKSITVTNNNNNFSTHLTTTYCYISKASTCNYMSGNTYLESYGNVYMDNKNIASVLFGNNSRFHSNWILTPVNIENTVTNSSNLYMLYNVFNNSANITGNINSEISFNLFEKGYYLKVINSTNTNSNLNINDNRFELGQRWSIYADGYNANIFNNTINKPYIPNQYMEGFGPSILLYSKSGKTNRIYNNIIFTSNELSGISIINSPGGSIYIYDNKITINQCPLVSWDANYYGININNVSAPTYINNNNIKLSISNSQYKSNGIIIDNSSNININDNILDVSNNGSSKGINITNSNAYLKNNTTKFSYYGIYITGNCNNTTIKCNKLWGNYYGIRLENATLQNQGTAVKGEASGNVWHGDYGGCNERKLSGSATSICRWYWANNESTTFYPPGTLTPVSHNPTITCLIHPNPQYLIYPTQGPDSDASNCKIFSIGSLSERNSEIENIPENNENINIYPNPASDFLIIDHLYEAVNIQIYDMQGKCVINKQNISHNTEISISHLEQGIYMYIITDKYTNLNKSGKINVVK